MPLVYYEKGEKKVFDNMDLYLKWKEDTTNNLKDLIKSKLNPMEYYMTQFKGTERPYTGDYWDVNTPGIYSCKTCTQRMFR